MGLEQLELDAKKKCYVRTNKIDDLYPIWAYTL